MKTIAYICGPFSGSFYRRKRNIENANAVALEFWKRGYAVLCPHANSGNLYKRGVAEELFLNGYLTFIKAFKSLSFVLVVLPGSEKSEGSMRELSLALECGHSIEYISRTQLDEYKKNLWRSKKGVTYV